MSSSNASTVLTKRQSIPHLQAMKPIEFVSWIKNTSGVLSGHKVVMKVDGLGFRFGKDTEGNIFIEGSKTGPIFDVGSFYQYSATERSKHYDDMLELFKNGSFMKDLPNDFKCVCELFYNPMANEDQDGIVFVTVKYDKSLLGDLMTILPYTIVSSVTGEEHPDKANILKSLFAKSNSEIKVIDPNLSMSSIDISRIITPIESIRELDVLQSRKRQDSTKRAELLALIQEVKDELSDFILNHTGIEDKFKLGPEIEGIVIHINQRPYKITTSKFKEAHNYVKQWRRKI